LEYQKDLRTTGSDFEAANKTAKEKFDRERTGLTNFSQDQSNYTPMKTATGLKFQIANFQNITTTTCGAKLKKLLAVK
jgi:hypothetical protein